MEQWIPDTISRPQLLMLMLLSRFKVVCAIQEFRNLSGGKYWCTPLYAVLLCLFTDLEEVAFGAGCEA